MYYTSTIQQKIPLTHTHTHTPLQKILPISRKKHHHATPPTPHRKSHQNATSRRGTSRRASKSSSVNRRFCAVASCRFKAYSAQTRWESTNSASHVCTWRQELPGVGGGWVEPGWGGYGWLLVLLVKGGFFVGLVLQTAVTMVFYYGWIG